MPLANTSKQAKDSDKSYSGIRRAIKGGQLDMPEFNGSGFYEGNHRVLELKRQGFKEVYVLAHPEHAAQLEEKYGVGPKQYQAVKTPAPAIEPEPDISDGKSAVQKYVYDRRNGLEQGGSLPDF